MDSFMHPSQIDFIIKINFFAISLKRLIKLLDGSKEDVWNFIHKTVGKYSLDT